MHCKSKFTVSFNCIPTSLQKGCKAAFTQRTANQTKGDPHQKEGEFVDTQVKSQGKRYMNSRKEKCQMGMKDMTRAKGSAKQ